MADEMDEIIEMVARWVRPNVDMAELKASPFYGSVKNKVEELIGRE
ncbi:MAG: hypothetical protein V1934_00400 [Methanobacteriota archaeon]